MATIEVFWFDSTESFTELDKIYMVAYASEKSLISSAAFSNAESILLEISFSNEI